ncbi:hypothetical protein GCM10010402_35420 [Actinomadura luteofluorescens]|nr:hypothetical protein [Actinomadura glauciflava]
MLWGRRRWNVERLGLSEQDAELLAISHVHFHGRFMLTPAPGSRPSLQASLLWITAMRIVFVPLATRLHKKAVSA